MYPLVHFTSRYRYRRLDRPVRFCTDAAPAASVRPYGDGATPCGFAKIADMNRDATSFTVIAITVTQMQCLRILQLGDAVRKRAERSSGAAQTSWCSRVPILGGDRFGTCPRGLFAHYFLPISINWGTRGLARFAYLHHEARKRGWGGYTWCTLTVAASLFPSILSARARATGTGSGSGGLPPLRAVQAQGTTPPPPRRAPRRATSARLPAPGRDRNGVLRRAGALALACAALLATPMAAHGGPNDATLFHFELRIVPTKFSHPSGRSTRTWPDTMCTTLQPTAS